MAIYELPTNPVKFIAISEFKATCLAVLERVHRTGTSVLVTRPGVPVAEINPPSPATFGADWMGSMRASATIVGDLVASDAQTWVRQLLDAMPRREAPVTHDIAIMSRQLKTLHQDPPDRFLAATARVMGLTLVTADERRLGTTEYEVMANR